MLLGVGILYLLILFAKIFDMYSECNRGLRKGSMFYELHFNYLTAVWKNSLKRGHGRHKETSFREMTVIMTEILVTWAREVAVESVKSGRILPIF